MPFTQATQRDGAAGLMGVGNALEVLELFGTTREDLGVAEVSRLLGLPRSTAYRLLSTLEQHRFVEQRADTRKYRLGLRVFELAGAVWARLDLRDLSLAPLEQLARETQETVHLAVYDRGESVVIEKVDGPREVYLRSHVGSRRPVHCTATGKVLIASRPTAEIEEILATGLRRFSASTETDPERFRAQLEAVRRNGYAVNWGEYRDEAAGVAAPVRDRTGQVRGAIGVAAPIGRLAPDRVETVAQMVTRCAAELSRYLGWRSSPEVPDDTSEAAA